MQFTKSSIDALRHVMKKNNLDKNKIVFEIKSHNGNLSIRFCPEITGEILFIEDLRIVVDGDLKNAEIVVDFGEVNGKKGIIFLQGNQNVH